MKIKLTKLTKSQMLVRSHTECQTYCFFFFFFPEKIGGGNRGGVSCASRWCGELVVLVPWLSCWESSSVVLISAFAVRGGLCVRISVGWEFFFYERRFTF